MFGHVDHLDGVAGDLGLLGGLLVALAAHLVAIPDFAYLRREASLRGQGLEPSGPVHPGGEVVPPGVAGPKESAMHEMHFPIHKITAVKHER
jgi:hypothetical protein